MMASDEGSVEGEVHKYLTYGKVLYVMEQA